MRTITLMSVSALLFLTTFSSCKDNFVEQGEKKTDQTTITINVPAPTTMATRSMTAKEECEILTIDVLVFDATTNEYMYNEKGVDIVDGTLATDKKFTMKIKQTTSPASVYLLVYANVSDEIDSAISDGTIAVGKSRDEIMRSLLFSLPTDTSVDAQGGKWLVKPSRYTRFPMWGQSAEITLTDAVITVAPVTLLRACAKIDIGLSFSGETTTQLTNFFLEEYYLYNALNKLYIAPDPSNISGAVVTAESVPTSATPFDVIKYIRREPKLAAGYKEFLSEIYIAEHPKGSVINRPTNPCIVVGARFGVQTNPITYYRIDLVKTTTDGSGVVTSQEYLPVLRNHRYKINITRVHARGYDTPTEAFNAMGLNTNLDVVIENQDESITNIVYDGQYMLGVDYTTYTEDKRVIAVSQAKVLKISTNNDSGWKISSNQPTWLKFVNDADTEVTSLTGVTGQTNVRFTLAANATAAARVATITLQAGRLFQTITVTQSGVADIETSNFAATIYPMNGVAKTFTVKSVYAWKAKIVDDNYNLITSFTASGGPSATGQTYTFNTMNEIAEDNLSVATERQTVKIVIFSPTGEFEDFEQPIKLDTYWEVTNVAFYVYGKDQGQATWYTQNNVAEGVNVNGSPGTQVVPARVGSCAAIPSLDPLKPWRVPLYTELTTMASSSTILSLLSVAYWSSQTYSSISYGYYTTFPGGSTNFDTKPTNHIARCVRTK